MCKHYETFSLKTCLLSCELPQDILHKVQRVILCTLVYIPVAILCRKVPSSWGEMGPMVGKCHQSFMKACEEGRGSHV